MCLFIIAVSTDPPEKTKMMRIEPLIIYYTFYNKFLYFFFIYLARGFNIRWGFRLQKKILHRKHNKIIMILI